MRINNNNFFRENNTNNKTPHASLNCLTVPKETSLILRVNQPLKSQSYHQVTTPPMALIMPQ